MRFFTADLHLGHANIISYCARPFADVEQMNRALLANWCSVVGPDDEVWVLGDVALGRISESLPLVAGLTGRKHLVPGNHDRCWEGHRRRREADVAMYVDVGFEVHPSVVPLRVAGHDLLASHLPYRGDSGDDDRFPAQRPADSGQWLLHGHVHQRWTVCERQINVGVDVWNFRPVPETALAALLPALR